jgi:hypothetical protein
MPKTRAHRRPEHGTCGRADADATQERRAFARSHQHSSPALAASEVSNGRHIHSSRPRTGPQRAPNRAMPFRLRGSWALEGPTPQPSASGPTYCRFQYSNSMRNQTNASPRHTPIDACLSGAGLDSSQERPYENTSEDLPGHTPEPACSVRDSWSWVPTPWAHGRACWQSHPNQKPCPSGACSSRPRGFSTRSGQCGIGRTGMPRKCRLLVSDALRNRVGSWSRSSQVTRTLSNC